MKPDTDITYQAVTLFSSDKRFIYFISYVTHYIRWNQYNTACTILVNIDVLDTWRAMICSYFGIILWRKKILFTHLSNLARTCSLMDWFLISWTSRLTGFLNLSRYYCYHHLDLSMIKDFYGFVMFSLSLSNSVQQRQRNFTKDADQKMFISWQTYEGLEISVN